MRGENHDGASRLGAQVRGGQIPKHVSRSVNLDLFQADLTESGRQPMPARFLAEWRRWNPAQLCLPVHNRLGISMHPRKRRVNRPLSGNRRDTGKRMRA